MLFAFFAVEHFGSAVKVNTAPITTLHGPDID